MDVYTKRKAVLLLLALAGFVCYALPFGRVSFFVTLEFSGWGYISILLQHSMYNNLDFWVIVVAMALLAVEAILVARIDLRFLESKHKYNDSNYKYIALLPLAGAVLLVIWYVNSMSGEGAMFGKVEFGFFLTVDIYIVNAAAVYLVLRRPRH